MPKISTRVTFHRSQASALVKASSNYGLTAMGNQALQDASQYVPRDQGIWKGAAYPTATRRRPMGSSLLNGRSRMRSTSGTAM